MTSDEQLNEWVNGNSIHNHERDECCPDFSCCQSHYMASEAEKALFRDRPDLRHEMLMGFLSAAINARVDASIHVAGSVRGEA